MRWRKINKIKKEVVKYSPHLNDVKKKLRFAIFPTHIGYDQDCVLFERYYKKYVYENVHISNIYGVFFRKKWVFKCNIFFD